MRKVLRGTVETLRPSFLARARRDCLLLHHPWPLPVRPGI